MISTARFDRAIRLENIYRFAGNSVYLVNHLKLDQTELFVQKFIKDVRARKLNKVVINLNELEDIDSSGVIAINFMIHRLQGMGVNAEWIGGSEHIQHKMKLFQPKGSDTSDRFKQTGLLEKLGTQVWFFLKEYVAGFIILAADMLFWAITDVFRSKTRRDGEVLNQSVLIGVNATLIIVMMSFIIGLVMSVHSAAQLKIFGANVYIVDIIVIAMMSQMGPLITAILVAGRSGSAIAAEIATMKVTSELDALTTMGLNPIRFVVVPKIYASMITMPFLIVLSVVSGILGGALAANIYLDITPEIFFNRMGSVMHPNYFIYGLIKSQAYAGIIVLTGSFYGFRVVRGAEGVGKATTNAVVVAISLVIIADSILGLIFY